jgi:hypothetical protein
MTTTKGKTLLAGHTLILEGEGYKIIAGYPARTRNNGDGCAKCSCGQFSPTLPNRAARKRWHKEHKEEVRQKLAGMAQ